jgi:putative endonuclease
LDLVVREGRTIVFCEVKSRTGDRFGLPLEAVTPTKQARIRRLAARWLREHPMSAGGRRWELRFDVASVLGDRLDVLEGAF